MLKSNRDLAETIDKKGQQHGGSVYADRTGLLLVVCRRRCT
jgi:hypothetical protein